jgi:hypothetical protein
LILEGETTQNIVKIKKLDADGEVLELPLDAVQTWLQKFFS